MQMQPITSSHIEAIGYDDDTRTLAVAFKGSGTYHYVGVPPDTHAALITSESVGRAFQSMIRAAYTGKKAGA